MNEVTKTEARAYPATVLAPLTSAGTKGSSGKVLPQQVPDVAAQSVNTNQEAPEKTERSADMINKVKSAVAQMNEYIQSTQRDLHFSFDAEAGETVIKVLDRKTQDVIRQIPDEIFFENCARY